MPRPTLRAPLHLALGLALGLAGCDRPVVDLAGPRIEVVQPADLGVVQPGATLDLAFRADVFGDLDSVRVGGRRAAFDPNRTLYEIEVPLFGGLNVLPVDVYDATGLRGSDTLYVVRASLEPLTAPVSGTTGPAAGAAATALPSGDVLVSGGAGASGQARAVAARLSEVGGVLAFDAVPLLDPRAAHSATALPDGRVLLIGGARTVAPAPLALVGTVEAVDAETGEAEPVAVVDQEGVAVAINRAGHEATVLTLDGITVIYLYGGVNAQGVPLGTFDIFRWDGATLTRLSPPGGTSGGFPAFAAPTLVRTGAQGAAEGSAVVLGLEEASNGLSAVALDWLAPTGTRYPFDLEGRTVRPLAVPRAETAGVFTEGFVLVAGGRAADGTTLDTFEAYVPSINRTFRFPEATRLATPRRDHSATLFPDGRILIVGGRDASGAPVSSVEVFRL